MPIIISNSLLVARSILFIHGVKRISCKVTWYLYNDIFHKEPIEETSLILWFIPAISFWFFVNGSLKREWHMAAVYEWTFKTITNQCWLFNLDVRLILGNNHVYPSKSIPLCLRNASSRICILQSPWGLTIRCLLGQFEKFMDMERASQRKKLSSSEYHDFPFFVKDSCGLCLLN